MKLPIKQIAAVTAAACAALVLTANVSAGEPAAGAKVLVAKTFRASKLSGLNVRNLQGEKVGTLDDLVINVETGKIAYAAIAVGGVFGIGDKLFAVPFSEMKFDHGKDEMYFVLNVSREKLHAAPGFNKSAWPDFADPNWSQKIDEYYRKAQSETRTGATTTEKPAK